MSIENYPRLSPEGEIEAQRAIDAFKKQMAKVCEDTLDRIYVDVAGYIETDSWTNFRKQFVYAFRRLDTNFCGQHNLKELAQVIAKECPEQIAGLVNQALVDEVAQLKDSVKWWQSMSRDP